MFLTISSCGTFLFSANKTDFSNACLYISLCFKSSTNVRSNPSSYASARHFNPVIHPWDQQAWDPVGHSCTHPLPHSQVWTSHLGAGSQRKAVQSQSQEHPWRGTPSTQRLRALHGGAGIHGGWRTSVPALCAVSPHEQSPLNPRGSGSVSLGQLRLRCVKDREGLPSSRAQSPF